MLTNLSLFSGIGGLMLEFILGYVVGGSLGAIKESEFSPKEDQMQIMKQMYGQQDLIQQCFGNKIVREKIPAKSSQSNV
jgi:hypothetical protein